MPKAKTDRTVSNTTRSKKAAPYDTTSKQNTTTPKASVQSARATASRTKATNTVKTTGTSKPNPVAVVTPSTHTSVKKTAKELSEFDQFAKEKYKGLIPCFVLSEGDNSFVFGAKGLLGGAEYIEARAEKDNSNSSDSSDSSNSSNSSDSSDSSSSSSSADEEEDSEWGGPELCYYGLEDVDEDDADKGKGDEDEEYIDFMGLLKVKYGSDAVWQKCIISRTKPTGDDLSKANISLVTLHEVEMLQGAFCSRGPPGKFFLWGVESMAQREIDRILTVVDECINVSDISYSTC